MENSFATAAGHPNQTTRTPEEKRAQREAARERRREARTESLRRWDVAARECGCELRDGERGALYQECVPSGHYIDPDEPPYLRDLHTDPMDAAANAEYLQKTARWRERSRDEQAFQERMQEAARQSRERKAGNAPSSS